MNYRTEDEVRDSAKLILGFDKTEPKVKQGTGQITTFNQLGFRALSISPMVGISRMIKGFLQLFSKQNQKQRIFLCKSGRKS